MKKNEVVYLKNLINDFLRFLNSNNIDTELEKIKFNDYIRDTFKSVDINFLKEKNTSQEFLWILQDIEKNIMELNFFLTPEFIGYLRGLRTILKTM